MKKLIKGLIFFSATCSTLAIADNSLTFTPGALIKSPAMLNVDGTLLTFSPNGEYALFKKGTDYFVYQTSNWKKLSSFHALDKLPKRALLDDYQRLILDYGYISGSLKEVEYQFFQNINSRPKGVNFNLNKSAKNFYIKNNQLYFDVIVFDRTKRSRIVNCEIEKIDFILNNVDDKLYDSNCISFNIKPNFYSDYSKYFEHGLYSNFSRYSFHGQGNKDSSYGYYVSYLPSSAYNVKGFNKLDNINNAVYFSTFNEDINTDKLNLTYFFNGGEIYDSRVEVINKDMPSYSLDFTRLCFTLNNKNPKKLELDGYYYRVIPHVSRKFIAFNCGDFTTFYKAEDLLNPYLGYDKDVIIDMVMAKITKSISNNDNKEALRYMNYLQTLNVKLPEAFYPQYIKVLDANKYSGSVKDIANDYIQKYGKAGKFYGEMIEVLSR